MARREFQVEIPGYDYFRSMIRCQDACPVQTDARGYVTAIAEGDFERAFQLAREPNPLVSTCGRICAAPCEEACRRGKLDDPVTIRALKRFVTEQFGSESDRASDRDRRYRSDLAQLAAAPSRKTGKVAVIGAGPAGLSCAHDLALLGHSVTILEAQERPGGMMILGIPEYRLSRSLVDAEVRAIVDLGVEIQYNRKLGRDVALDDLRAEGYETFFFGIGAHQSRGLAIDGADSDGILRAVDFLLNVNMGYKTELGQRVLIVGGGNVAFDVARSVVRKMDALEDMSVAQLRRTLAETRSALEVASEQTSTTAEEMTIAMDAARSALRLGSKEVQMVCLERRWEMPATDEEIEDGLIEGITLFPGKGPKRFLTRDGKVVGLETLDVASVFDSQGRFSPTFKEGTEQVYEADTVILAIGQSSDLSFLKADDGVEVHPRGPVVVDPATLATTTPEIFAGGDVAFGPRLLINAVADGRRAARSIDAHLQGKSIRLHRSGRMTALRDHTMAGDFLQLKRQPAPSLPIDRRIGIAEVELGYGEEDARSQARRCLKCAINTVFDGDRCVCCGGCVDVCPENCLKLVSVAQLSGDKDLAALFQARYGASAPAEGTAMIKDEDRCIRCGCCARRCPADAITMEFFQFKEEMQYD